MEIFLFPLSGNHRTISLFLLGLFFFADGIPFPSPLSPSLVEQDRLFFFPLRRHHVDDFSSLPVEEVCEDVRLFFLLWDSSLRLTIFFLLCSCQTSFFYFFLATAGTVDLFLSEYGRWSSPKVLLERPSIPFPLFSAGEGRSPVFPSSGHLIERSFLWECFKKLSCSSSDYVGLPSLFFPLSDLKLSRASDRRTEKFSFF